ncbi:MAG: alkaline phosphatase [Candidatus Muiribacteriota bacterium]
MKTKIILVLFCLLISVTVFSDSQAKNVIILIGDGMSYSTNTLARVINDGQLSMDEFPVTGSITTHSKNHLITDSAAAGTAISTGHKTANGLVGVLPDGTKLKNLTEAAQELGKKTGIVTTTTISHATPGSFSAHIPNRGHQYDIAKQQMQSGIDILMGGGMRYFKELLDDAEKKGYDVVKNRSELVKTTNTKVLGIFEEFHLNYDLDRELGEPSLALMVRKSIDLLDEDDNGFFLMVEGGRIDHAGHSNDPVGAIYDTFAFDRAVKEALDYGRRNKDTLVVVLSDHETGGLVLGRDGYNYKPEVIKGFRYTPDKIMGMLDEAFVDLKEKLELYTDYDWKDDIIDEIMELKDTKRPTRWSEGGLATALFVRLINSEANIDWTTNDHAGGEVPVFAFGPQAEIFTGTYDNTDIPKKISAVAGLSLDI